MIAFYCSIRLGATPYYYAIVEWGTSHPSVNDWHRVTCKATPGELVWLLGLEGAGSSRGSFVVPRTGRMTQTAVTPEDAMILTGLDHPMAAMDRLRDWVTQGFID